MATNLTQAETLSLLAAGLSRPETVQFSAVPLAPPAPAPPGVPPLRQIDPGAAVPLWPAVAPTP